MSDSKNFFARLGGERGWFWPVFLLGLLVTGAGTNLMMVYIAVSDPSFAVEHNYYQKALRWDQTMSQERKSRALGWQIKLQFSKTSEGQMPSLQVLDRKGALLPGAEVRLEMFSSARANQRYTRKLSFSAREKAYLGLPMAMRRGLWVFDIRVDHDGQRFMTRQSLWVGAPPDVRRVKSTD